MMTKQIRKHKKPILLLAFTMALLIPIGFSYADATGTLNPASLVGLINQSIPVECTGLTASTYYTVYIIDEDLVETLVVNKTTDSSGVLTFSVSFDTAGDWLLEIREVTGVTLQVSGNVDIRDINADFEDAVVPYIPIAFTIVSIVIFLSAIGGCIFAIRKKAKGN